MHRSLVAVMLALAVAHSANAATITATASGGDFDNPVTDVEGPANSGNLLAEVIIPVDSFSDMEARAALDVDGNSAVALDGLYFTTGKTHLAGVTFPQVTDGETIWSETITNNSAGPKSYLYSFHLNPISLLLDLFYGGSETNPLAPLVSYRVEVRANNALIFESQAILEGGSVSHVLIESGTDLGGVFASDEGSLSYTFAAFDGAFSVGTAGPGESITVVAKLIAHTEAYFDGSGGLVTMGDPLDLKGDPGVSSVIFDEGTVGVEPASWSAAKQLYR